MWKCGRAVRLALIFWSVDPAGTWIASIRYSGRSLVVGEGAAELTSTALATGAGIDGAADVADAGAGAAGAAAGPDADVAQRYI